MAQKNSALAILLNCVPFCSSVKVKGAVQHCKHVQGLVLSSKGGDQKEALCGTSAAFRWNSDKIFPPQENTIRAEHEQRPEEDGESTTFLYLISQCSQCTSKYQFDHMLWFLVLSRLLTGTPWSTSECSATVTKQWCGLGESSWRSWLFNRTHWMTYFCWNPDGVLPSSTLSKIPHLPRFWLGLIESARN